MDIIQIKRKATMCKEKLIQHMFQIYLRTLILQINASTAVSNETAGASSCLWCSRSCKCPWQIILYKQMKMCLG